MATHTPELPDHHDIRTGTSAEAFQAAFLEALLYTLGRFPEVATPNDRYLALAAAVRDRMLARWIATGRAYRAAGSRTVVYLSAEYLLGPHLGMNLLDLDALEPARQAMEALGLDLGELLAQEEEPGLGNGGLGRLAACFMDSLATLRIPAIGYGIRYEFGIFDQEIRDGWQLEVTDKWLRLGNPWELARPEIRFEVNLGGFTRAGTGEDGRYRVEWIPERVVMGVAHDTCVLGYEVANANLLRLWRATAAETFDFQAFNQGDYWGAVEEKVDSENLTKVLYPNDEGLAGKLLRLQQQYFFVSCSLQDMIRIHLQVAGDLSSFHQKYAAQLNDTHPAIAVAELMRLLVDVHGMDWDPAWEITRSTFGYTNHTLLPEALERWPVELLGAVLPRHLEIILEINHHFLEEVRARFPGDEDRIARMSLIAEAEPRSVRMAHLASVGSHRINGVAALHSRLLTEEVLRDFHDMWPERFASMTNGVTPRRFVKLINPGLSQVLDEVAGPRWPVAMERLRALEPLVEDAGFRDRWRAIKAANKRALAAVIRRRVGTTVDPESLFDVQVKRIHEYKRQHLNVLHVMALHRRLAKDPNLDVPPRTVVFAGKAAPGYRMAKLIIKLIHSVGDTIARDPRVRGRLQVVFLPDFNVQNAEAIFPAADLSEQISLAGKEASGTGNMKFTMNGALTIGTLDGANVEIREEVGAENFFLFGMTVEEVRARRAAGYRPRSHLEADPELAELLEALAAGAWSPGEPELFQPLVDSLLDDDPFMLLADYRDYVDAQDRVGRSYQDQEAWTRMSILQTARSGKFSSDRTIAEYCREIWRVSPIDVEVPSLRKVQAPARATKLGWRTEARD